MMRRREVGVQVARFDEVLSGSLQIAAPELDIPEVHPCLGEARAVLEGDGKTRLGGVEVTGSQRGCAILVELEGLWRQRRDRRASRHEPGPNEDQEEDRERDRAHM